jgi:hypothetical protein
LTVRFACSKKTSPAAKNHPRQQMTEAKNGSFTKENKKSGLAGDHVAKKCATVAKIKIVDGHR